MLEMKPWYQSKTVWGALIAIAAPLLGRAGLEVADRIRPRSPKP